MATSPDGITWTPVTDSKLTNGIRAIAYGNGTFVTADNGGNIATSSDNGVTWGAISPKPFTTGGGGIGAIAYGDSKFIAVSDFDSKIAYSSNNGATWTAVDLTSIFGTTGINAITYANNKFVAGGSVGRIATSPDGTTWTIVGDKILGTDEYNDVHGIGAIAYGSGTVVVVSYFGKNMAYLTGF